MEREIKEGTRIMAGGYTAENPGTLGTVAELSPISGLFRAEWDDGTVSIEDVAEGPSPESWEFPENSETDAHPFDYLTEKPWSAYLSGDAFVPAPPLLYADERPLYDHCGCIFPCPDHKSPAQDGKRDRDYWNDH